MTPRLVLFSGLGIPPRLLTPQLDIAASGTRVELIDWPDIRAGETMSGFAQRIARSIDVQPHEPLYLGGMSFGGFVALEVAQFLEPKSVFLVAAARSGRALSPIVKMTVTIASRLPIGMLR